MKNGERNITSNRRNKMQEEERTKNRKQKKAF